ncbi:helix-turn-helix transcriptional regulator [Streptomyces sp. NPDC002920]
MANNAEEIKEFLRTRRDALRPSQAGLTNYPGRRVPGLRREEVAMLAGVSVDYYTRLEQGRLTSASERVILSIAEALQLPQAETQYLRDLLRPRPQRARGPAPRRQARPELLRLLDGMHCQPAYILDTRHEVLASNALLDALLTPFNRRDAEDRSLLRWMLLDPAARELFLDWTEITFQVVGALRVEVARNPHDARTAALVDELTTASPEFRTWWAEHTVIPQTWGTMRFDHPVVGRLDITYEVLTLPSDPDQVLPVFTGKTETDLDKLRILASWNTQHTQPVPTGGRAGTPASGDTHWRSPEAHTQGRRDTNHQHRAPPPWPPGDAVCR